MPIITVKLAAGRSESDNAALLDGVRHALLTAFSLPGSECYALLEEYPPQRMAFPPEEPGAVLVEVRCFAGRTPAQKAAFYRLAAQAVTAAGLDGASMVAVILDTPLENWGICGGRSALDVFAT